MSGELETILGMGLKAAETERERALALEATLDHAATMGMDRALHEFGAMLSEREKALVRTLTQEECRAWKEIRSKLGGRVGIHNPAGVIL